MSRKLTQRSRYSKSLDSVRSSLEWYNEYVFHKCEAKLLLQKKVKNGDVCSQAGAEEVVKRIGKLRPYRISLLLTEEMIRLKFLQSPFTRTAILYSQIEGIYSAEKDGNVIIIGNRSRTDKVRAYECIRVKNQEDYIKLRELLLEACRSPDRKLPKQLSIGTLQIDPGKHTSRRGSLGSLIWEKPDFNESEPIEVRPVSVYPHDAPKIPGTPALIYSGNPDINGPNHIDQLKYKEIENEADRNESVRTSSSVDDLNHISPIKINKLFGSIGTNSSHTTLTPSQQLKPENLVITSNTSNGEWAKGVIYLDPNSSRGTLVNDEGPVYMYCETKPFVMPT